MPCIGCKTDEALRHRKHTASKPLPLAPNLIGRPARELKFDKLNGEINATKTDLATFNGPINDINAVRLTSTLCFYILQYTFTNTR
jgi:hypothetical protein